MTPELHQFRFSHFNEKARWAFDFKGVPHVRRSYLPGPHMLSIARLSGQRQVPVLRVGSEIVVGSDRIIDYLESRHPAPPLYPPTETARRRALELQRWFDEEIGPTIRRAFFFDFLDDGDYAARAFTQGQGMTSTTIYRLLFPAIRVVMRRDMQIEADGAARGRDRAREALDLIASTAGTDGYLVGEQFSVADLTAAALLSLTVFPPECPARVPEPKAPGLRAWLARWADHPAIAWINRMYAHHRGQSAESAA